MRSYRVIRPAAEIRRYSCAVDNMSEILVERSHVAPLWCVHFVAFGIQRRNQTGSDDLDAPIIVNFMSRCTFLQVRSLSDIP